ncbi:MAG TPA: hypothetical protein VIF88_15580 [Methylocystis sp.]|jgi:hypothetical protein
MRLVTFIGAAYAFAILSAPIAQAANAPLCLAIAENYNTCMRQHQYGRGGGGYGQGYGQGYGGGYGRGYGGGGYGRGYPGDDDDDGGDGGYGGYGGYGGGSPRRRYENAKAACAIWFAQMQASGCFN